MKPRTGITPSGRFIYGIHKPAFRVENLRKNDFPTSLGRFADGPPRENRINFPEGAVEEESADWIFEIPNAFPFRGTTYIARRWAEKNSRNPENIRLPLPGAVSLFSTLKKLIGEHASTEAVEKAMASMPEPVLLSIAATSTDPDDLLFLARLSCEFEYDEEGNPAGLIYVKDSFGKERAAVGNHDLFEVVVNNIHLPDLYKEVMVLRPGVQGGSEIVGEWYKGEENSHIFEYLRRNSYIPWGHYAANMANDAIRYRIEDLMETDMEGLRHLYYQRTFVRMAEELGLSIPGKRRMLTEEEMETLRMAIMEKLPESKVFFNSTLWGWNYGFDFASSGFRLHASHQMIHQQFALLPKTVAAFNGFESPDETFSSMEAYGCGDLVADLVREYRKTTGHGFFEDYIRAIRSNIRMDEKSEGERSLVVHEDENVMVFVPKAQTSQWELQLMPLKPVGNILEADTAMRNSLDRAMHLVMKVLTGMGARMITTIEFPKRFDDRSSGQHLLYSFLPKMPDSPGAFSEAQLRWINGHYPEDFAIACRKRL